MQGKSESTECANAIKIKCGQGSTGLGVAGCPPGDAGPAVGGRAEANSLTWPTSPPGDAEMLLFLAFSLAPPPPPLRSSRCDTSPATLDDRSLQLSSAPPPARAAPQRRETSDGDPALIRSQPDLPHSPRRSLPSPPRCPTDSVSRRSSAAALQEPARHAAVKPRPRPRALTGSGGSVV